MTASVTERRLAGHQFADFALLDAVEQTRGNERLISLFFDGTIDPALIKAPKGASLADVRSVGGATIVRFELSARSGTVFNFAGLDADVTCAEAELAPFEGRNALAAVRNGESASTVVDWLAYQYDRGRAVL